MNAPSAFTESAVENDSPTQQLSKPIPYTAPGHLRAVAHLYGIETISLEKARVLELGCETGGNLLPFALAYPKAQVVGVDLWPENIRRGEKAASCLNAQNVVLHSKPFTEIDKNFGEFDYIIVHDQFTWAPSALREAILRICRENLSPLGIAYISYNTYPGWKAGDTLRDAMQLHNHSASSMEEVLSGAAAMLNPMSDGLANNNPQATSLKAAVEKISKHPDYYINSEFLQANAASFYFIEFAEAAAQAGLAYVGDAEPQDEISATHGQNVQLNHSLVTLGQPKVMKQQYLDFVVGREFRKSLFIHQERATSILNAPDFTRFTSLNWAASLKQGNFSTAVGKSANFFNSSGKVFSITDEAAIRICNTLASVWPISVSYEYLIAATQDAEAWLQPEKVKRVSEDIQRALETLFKIGALHYSLDAGPYDQAKNNRLQSFTNIESFLHSKSDEDNIINGFNLWHMPMTLRLKPSQIRLLQAINGKHSTEQLLALALHNSEPESESREEYAVLSDGKENTGNDKYITEFTQLIGALRAQGALLGSSTAWLDYFKTMLSTEILPSVSRLEYLNPYLQHLKRTTKQNIKTNVSLQTKTQTKAGINGVPAFQQKPEAINTFNQIQALRRQQRFSDAEPIARSLTTAHPANATSWHLLGILLGEMGETEQSISPLFKALSLLPGNVAVYADLSTALQTLKERQHAEALLRHALKIDHQCIPNWLNYGNLLRSQDKTSLAEICYRKALSINPSDSGALNNLSAVLGDQGRLAESIDCLRNVMSTQPDNHMAHSNLLFMLSQYADITPAELFKEHRAFGLRLEKNKKNQAPHLNHTNLRDPQKVLRLGFVSGDLCNHAVASFLEPIWESFNKQEFELYAYSNTPAEDAVTQRLKTHVKSWKKVRQLNDQALAQQINTDGIDILFDLSGHTAHNRLPMFALKPAPVQVSWIGYPGTTGLQTMDGFLVDKNVAPIGLLDEQFSEKLVRLPCPASFQPAPESPDVKPLPAMRSGYITFGSFNRLSKINEKMIMSWSKILNLIPDAKLLLGHMHGATMSTDVASRFKKHGIAKDRLLLRERTSMQEYLRLHHQVDLLLDTYPYTGGTTTNHGLWMGIPTLTLVGSTLASRQGAALMNQVGLADFVTHTPDEYINKAITWSHKLEDLAKLRATMRQRIKESRMDSSELVTLGIELALKRMWNNWCIGKPSESFEITL